VGGRVLNNCGDKARGIVFGLHGGAFTSL
jgi:hypothetical protein